MRESQIWDSLFYDVIQSCYIRRPPIYKGTNTLVYIMPYKDDEIEHVPDILLFSKDSTKYEYYEYALSRGFKYIPKIYDMGYDAMKKIYYIRRSSCNPIFDPKKLKRIEKIKFNLSNPSMMKMGIDPVCDELLEYYEICKQHKKTIFNKLPEFDFSQDWIMQTDYGKLVVCDAFWHGAKKNV